MASMASMSTRFSFLLVFALVAYASKCFGSEEALPFIVLHGIGDQCSNPGVSQFVQLMADFSGAQGTCLEIGDGLETSWTTRLDYQVEEVCRKVKKMKHLANGFNLVGLSQGALIGRGYIEWCDDAPPVRTLISLGGPNAGVASTPLCGSPFICQVVDFLIKFGVYTSYVQNRLAPAGYVKIPTSLDAYYKGCVFLPRLNNELAAARMDVYKRRLAAIDRLVLILFLNDTVVVPKESAHFGYFAPNTFGPVVPFDQTQLYKEDWIGLRELNEAGRVDFISVPGGHLRISRQDLEDYVSTYLMPTKRRDTKLALLSQKGAGSLRGRQKDGTLVL
eukprot:TRINITY_DN21280_c0_g1_i1.p1 TRINITY_DN21280_c0_g1~~TRINITY_DN21280_c0_g1_i1.p1  ORF type:complete len:333 (+),score=23.38 TRINITY_DN21280_c0_g1_i1:460-1458(+)